MGDVSGCQPTLNNLAFYLQGVSVQPSSTITSEYFVTASLPSSASLRRVWQFTTQGTITGTSTLTLDYTQAAQKCPTYNITFEGALNGLLTIHNQTFSANKYISYTLLSQYVLQLTIKIPKKIIECYGAGTTQDYYFDVYVNDSSCNSKCYSSTGSTTGYKIVKIDLSKILTTSEISVYSENCTSEQSGKTGTVSLQGIKSSSGDTYSFIWGETGDVCDITASNLLFEFENISNGDVITFANSSASFQSASGTFSMFVNGNSCSYVKGINISEVSNFYFTWYDSSCFECTGC